MKKKALRKLNLHRETIRSLEHSNLQNVHGATADCQNNTRTTMVDPTRARGCDSTVEIC
jgi:hypothetical protein